MKESTKRALDNAVNFINFSLKVDANSTCTVMAFQPKAPEKLNKFKKNDK